ncbi:MULTISPECIES: hypothetical protein [Rhodopirellula]|uniref:hypothetical protein n=1 Tax=Rhodopirellula TaxID=265488 RepID=UPI00257D1167|nr:hypothetical protein [Rhodopirellula sp. UBA1907]|tara:strand:+ start:9346 stop:9711 length:366 start_codon:yes stop_codon:yes gene_type:complete
MNRRFFALLAVALLFLMLVSFAWVANRSIRWVTSLPDRIEIRFEDDAMTAVITECIRASLTQPDTEMQTQSLHALLRGVEENPELADWLQTECGSELKTLRNSTDVGVASMASMLMSKENK